LRPKPELTIEKILVNSTTWQNKNKQISLWKLFTFIKCFIISFILIMRLASRSLAVLLPISPTSIIHFAKKIVIVFERRKLVQFKKLTQFLSGLV